MRVFKFIIQTIKPYNIYILGIFFATFIVSIDNTIKPFLVKNFINIISNNSSNNLWLTFAYYAGLQLMLVLAWVLSDYCIAKYISKYRLDIAEKFMDQLYKYPYSFFQDHLSGSITSKINDAFQHLPHIIFVIVNDFFHFFLLILTYIILLHNISFVFSTAMMIMVLSFIAIILFSMKKGMMLNKQYAEEKSKIIGLIADYISNMASIKLFANRSFEKNRFKKLEQDLIDIDYKGGIYHIKVYALLGSVTSIYSFFFIYALIIGYQKNLVTPGDFALVIMANFNVFNRLYQLSSILKDFIANWGAVDQAIILLENTNITNLDKPDAKSLTCIRGEIIFDKVQFYYKNLEPIFQDKSIKINAKEKIGLVGYSGGGKSTFVNLILRLYDLTDGAILIDNQDIRDVTQDSLRENISMIPQDPVLFHRSLMENIRYGRVNASDEEVIEAAKKAHAHEFIMELEQGYDSLVGERGVKLSGGQRQRIAIARAILKNAPILILDEATSQLDSVTENLIQMSLLELMKDKTTIIIAHRLSTLLHMDRILVFDKGSIIQDGSHSDLLSQDGLYKELWNTQVGGFLGDRKIEEKL